MTPAQEGAALVVLLRQGRRSPQAYSDLIEETGSAVEVLERELVDDRGQTSLLALDLGSLLAPVTDEIARWHERGIRLVTLLDPGYPMNLRAVHDRPPLIFIAGRLSSGDDRSVAIVGSRRASPAGLDTARQMAGHLVAAGYVVASGLAAGIDTAAHTAALDAGGRTLAVIGTGLNHAFPPHNAGLQHRLAVECAVISRFWPDAPANRRGFPLRNAVMSGVALGTVIVEASARSGTRIQARQALAHGRPVFLTRPVAGQPWARELAARPGVYVVDSPADVTSTLERLHGPGALVG